MDTRVYIFCDTRGKKMNGEYAVYLLFKNSRGRFMVNTGLSSTVKFTGREFPKSVKNRVAKTNALNRYLLCAETICLANSTLSNKELKERLKLEILGKDVGINKKVLSDYIIDYAERAVADGTAELYKSTAKRVSLFDSAATFDSVNLDWLERFYKFLVNRGMRVNSIAIDMRNIRAVFNRAIDDEVTTNYPFRKYKIRTERTKKRNLTAEQVRTLRDYKCEDWQEEYRDLWMLQFYLAGINISDLLELKSLTDGRCVYRRKKTGRLYDIFVTKEAMEIINKYKGSHYLLNPLDRYGSATEYCRHMNRALKKIGEVDIVEDKAGKMRKKKYNPLFPDLTTYWSRHTWATIAAELDIPKEVIGKALGHSEWDNTTTDIYINFDNKKVDEAVRKVIDYVNDIKTIDDK